MDDAVQRARRNGVRRIEVTGNHHVLGFYESVGFVRVGKVVTAFGSTAVRMYLDVAER